MADEKTKEFPADTPPMDEAHVASKAFNQENEDFNGDVGVDFTQAKLSFVMKGIAGYRLIEYAKSRDVKVVTVAKELLIEAMVARGLIWTGYTLNDMRKGK